MTRDDWFISATGRRYYVLSPDPEQIYLDDIAHALSRICRFGGHLRADVDHYSVAQHSVMVSWLVPEEEAPGGLMHDGTEAICGNMISPLKRQMPEYRSLEAQWRKAFETRFGFAIHSPEIKHADWLALDMELRDLITPSAQVWKLCGGFGHIAGTPKLQPLDRRAAYRQFMERAEELGIK